MTQAEAPQSSGAEPEPFPVAVPEPPARHGDDDSPELAVPTTRRLREALVALDLGALTVGWALSIFVFTIANRTAVESVLLLVSVVGLGMWLMSVYGLYLTRVAAIRSVELSKLTRVAALTGLGYILVARVARVPHRVLEAVIGVLLALALLIAERSGFRAYLSHSRRQGRHTRSLLVVGTGTDAADLVRLLATHPEAGYRAVGVVGDRAEALANGLASCYLGTVDDTVAKAEELDVSGALLMVGSLSGNQLNKAVRELQATDIHIHMSNGLQGIDFRRLHALPIAYEPMFYLEAPVLAQRQFLLKRTLDLAGSVVGLVLTAPIFLGVWIAVKLDDRGPLFFKQVRVGRDGTTFTCLKFRTMVVDAEAKLKELERANERAGPLFKMTNDPRITPVGRFLRSSSLDELPQLLNVVKGEMSLVGPRPALPDEVARFDDDLMGRLKVRPGITGLWQVEARDNPSFDAYRRLDLFYVENWSLSLDLVVMLATAEHVIARVIASFFEGDESASGPMA